MINSGIRWHWIKKVVGYQQELKGYLGMGYLEMGYGATYGTIMLGWTYCESSKSSPIKKDPYILWVRKGFMTGEGWLDLVDEVMNQDIIYGCKSNYKVRNKVRDHTRSIPPFHTSIPYLFEGSVPIPLVPYLWSIRYDVCIYIYI